MINCEINLILTWSENFVFTDIVTQAANPNANVEVIRIDDPGGATSKIKDTNLYVLVVTLSTENDKRLLEQIKRWFKKKTIK